MTDLAVVLPESTCAETVDEFCSLLHQELARVAGSASARTSPIQVKILGAGTLSAGREAGPTLQRPSTAEFDFEAGRQSLPDEFRHCLVVGVLRPEAPAAAARVAVEFFHRRMICSSREAAGNSAAVSAQRQASTNGTGAHTDLVTPVDTEDAGIVILNDGCADDGGGGGTERTVVRLDADWGSPQRKRLSPGPLVRPVEVNDGPALRTVWSSGGRGSSPQHTASRQLEAATGSPSVAGGHDRSGVYQRPSGLTVFTWSRSVAVSLAVALVCSLYPGGDESMTAATAPAEPQRDVSTADSQSASSESDAPRSENGTNPSSQTVGAESGDRLETADEGLHAGVGSQRNRPGSAGAAGQTSGTRAADPRRTDGGNSRRAGGDVPELDQSQSAIEHRLLADVQYLAADEREGRGVRTRGLDEAADYLAKQFSVAGLNTSHFNGTPFQEFELLSIGGESPVQQIEFHGADGQSQVLVPDREFSSVVLSRSSRLDVPVVFAGFGISAPEVGYDDYQGVDVAEKAVIVLRHAPPVFDTPADDLAEYSYVRTKIATAAARGASAVVLCSDLSSATRADSRRAEAPASRPDALLRVELTLDDGVRPVPVVHIRRDVLSQVLTRFCDVDLDAVERQIVSSGRPSTRQLAGLRLAGRVSQTRRGRTLKNVVATLDPLQADSGDDPVETIVVGAHYDHLGRGGWGSLTLGANDQVHNGADDNASGTAVMLEVARQLAAGGSPLRRRVVFIGFSAEELGLIGSRKYVENPLVPMNETVAMLNLDMVGRLRSDRLTVYGTGSSRSWSPLLQTLAPRQNLVILGKSSGYGPSDHASFYEAGVPVLHFFTGFHPQYHRPEDDVEHLNVEGMRRIAGLLVDLVTALASREEGPARSLAGTSPDWGTTAGLITPQGERMLGIVPADRPQGHSGVYVRRTVTRSLADLHGIRTGDVIVRAGGQPVDSIEQLAGQVREQALGSMLAVEIVRNGIHMEVQVDFQH